MRESSYLRTADTENKNYITKQQVQGCHTVFSYELEKPLPNYLGIAELEHGVGGERYSGPR